MYKAISPYDRYPHPALNELKSSTFVQVTLNSGSVLFAYPRNVLFFLKPSACLPSVSAEVGVLLGISAYTPNSIAHSPVSGRQTVRTESSGENCRSPSGFALE